MTFKNEPPHNEFRHALNKVLDLYDPNKELTAQQRFEAKKAFFPFFWAAQHMGAPAFDGTSRGG